MFFCMWGKTLFVHNFTNSHKILTAFFLFQQQYRFHYTIFPYFCLTTKNICTFHFQWMNSVTLDISKCTFKCHGILHEKLLWSLLSIKVHLSYRNSFANLALFIEIVFCMQKSKSVAVIAIYFADSKQMFSKITRNRFYFFYSCNHCND